MPRGVGISVVGSALDHVLLGAGLVRKQRATLEGAMGLEVSPW